MTSLRNNKIRSKAEGARSKVGDRYPAQTGKGFYMCTTKGLVLI